MGVATNNGKKPTTTAGVAHINKDVLTLALVVITARSNTTFRLLVEVA